MPRRAEERRILAASALRGPGTEAASPGPMLSSRALGFLALLPLLSAACASPPDDALAESEAATSTSALPKAVGYIVRDLGGPRAWCVATLVAADRAVTGWPCTTSDFVSPGGQTVHAEAAFALAADVGDPSKWIALRSVRMHQHTTVVELASPVVGVTPVRVAGPPGAADVGQTFLTGRRDGGAGLLKPSTTVLRAAGGQGMHALFPVFDDFAKATLHPVLAQQAIADGPQYRWSVASVWQRPMFPGYEVLTAGANEASMTPLAAVSSDGAPLLRKLADGSLELVGIFKEAVDAEDPSDVPQAVLASYYTTFAPDTLAVIAGAPGSGAHCGDVPVGQAICRDGFRLECSDFGSTPILDIASSNQVFCGSQAKCHVKPYANAPGKSYAVCDD